MYGNMHGPGEGNKMRPLHSLNMAGKPQDCLNHGRTTDPPLPYVSVTGIRTTQGMCATVSPERLAARVQLPKNLSILQLNCCGVRGKITEITKLLHEQMVDVALLQETLLKKNPLHISGYSVYRCVCRYSDTQRY